LNSTETAKVTTSVWSTKPPVTKMKKLPSHVCNFAKKRYKEDDEANAASPSRVIFTRPWLTDVERNKRWIPKSYLRE
jgi:hypothetical protein